MHSLTQHKTINALERILKFPWVVYEAGNTNLAFAMSLTPEEVKLFLHEILYN